MRSVDLTADELPSLLLVIDDIDRDRRVVQAGVQDVGKSVSANGRRGSCTLALSSYCFAQRPARLCREGTSLMKLERL